MPRKRKPSPYDLLIALAADPDAPTADDIAKLMALAPQLPDDVVNDAFYPPRRGLWVPPVEEEEEEGD